MARRRARPSPPARAKASEFRNQPFRQLGKLAATTASKSAPAAEDKPVAPPPPVQEDGLTAFLREMADVRQLDGAQRARVDSPAPAQQVRTVVDADAEALAELSELVTGNGPFDISDSDEHVEGVVAGIDPRVVRRLRNGEFAYQAHLDLHGLTAAEARLEVDHFLRRAHQSGHRCVLIIHGRGRNSKDQIPVLKNRLIQWLARGQWSRSILAFTSARACDGGAGALYVLLRRDRKAKRPVHVVNGGKIEG
jgi:DNA-nicking Smr family endonuclease